MNKMILLFSHKLTEEQMDDAKNKLQCNEFIYLPQELQKCWSDVDPEDDISYNENLIKIKDYILNISDLYDYILIQGEFGYTYNIVNFALNNNFIPIYSTTKRESTEEIIDGKVKKTLNFKHVKFRKYK